MKKQSKNTKQAILIGAGIAALTAAGIYFFGPKGKQHQKKLKGWMIKMKGEIVERMENVKEMSENAYKEIIEQVAEQYKKHEKIAAGDITRLAEELKKQWKDIVNTGVKDSRRRRSASSRTQKGKTGAKKKLRKS